MLYKYRCYAKFILLLALICSGASHVLAQNELGVKLYQNLDVFKMTSKQWNADYSNYSILFSGYTHEVGRQTVALSWNLKNKYTNEFQLSFSNSPAIPHTYVRHSANADHITRIYTSIGYELSRILGNIKGTLYYSVGINQTLYFYRIHNEPPHAYVKQETNYGVLMGIVPRFYLRVTDKIKLELSSIVAILDIKHYTYLIANPQLPPKSQWIEKRTNAAPLPSYVNLRLGLCYSF